MQDFLANKIVPGANGQPQEVRFFKDSNLQNAIDSALSSVEDSSAILQIENNPDGVNAAIAAKLNGHWSIALGFTRSDWGDSVGAKVKFSWK